MKTENLNDKHLLLKEASKQLSLIIQIQKQFIENENSSFAHVLGKQYTREGLKREELYYVSIKNKLKKLKNDEKNS